MLCRRKWYEILFGNRNVKVREIFECGSLLIPEMVKAFFVFESWATVITLFVLCITDLPRDLFIYFLSLSLFLTGSG